MNERIRELAEQAGFNLGDMERHGVEPLFEKFAQLIGQECLNLADSIRDDCGRAGENQQALGAAWVGIAIARHFGISNLQQFSDSVKQAFKDGADLSNQDTP